MARNISTASGLRPPPGAASDPERRSHIARRFKTFWPTSLRIATAIRRAHVLNISQSGAKLHAKDAPEPGQAAEIEIDGEWLGGLVRWRRGESFGIAFYRSIPQADLQNFLDRQNG